MTGPMQADVVAQAASAKTISGLADQAQALIGQLQGEVDATQAIWQGGGHAAFAVGSADIHAQLQKGQAAMQEVSFKLGKSGTGYGSTDDQNAASLGSTGL
ncbi:hypothetical protein C1Y40_04524 [Mycobacterium talmoniae]|uniref:ESAT-6-like protein n=1 Tax=Mycobacterium talmoniae TaxID=1858794 RepID=A0A2S8BF91_9MYCO|nr:WXG100 family type VII secretion target [Mycobacterium eburneum]PQM45299.1 hypothetical protein C1Y40_04524 [Mycobacterium talmoniae]TDH48461.1 hypothetical protein E2F47_23635 [Mycobacterium eburneum]